MTFKCCAVIPSFNHSEKVGELLDALLRLKLPVLIVDDGSDEPVRSALSALHAPERGVNVVRLDRNLGKGGAVAHGFEVALASGFTHAVQVDADGQHDVSNLPDFIALAEANPSAMIAGDPRHDVSIPRSRRIGRRLTHFWVGIETLSLHPPDTMCGLRVYPLKTFAEIAQRHRLTRRMDFDIEIFVRFIWKGVPILSVPVRVTYPEGNKSNFHLVRDNWLITAMHTRLVCEMILRLPQIIRRRRRTQPPSHWASLAERGTYFGLSILAFFYRVAGRYVCTAILFPVALYFNLTGAEQRRASREFLRRAFLVRGINYEPGWTATLKHSFGFAQKTLDTFAAWVGGVNPATINPEDRREPDRVANSGRGILLIVSHLGNIEISRALLGDALRSKIKVLTHTINAENFARLLRKFRPEAMADTIQVTDFNPGTMQILEEAIARGDWVAIAGDRAPVREGGRVSMVPFLGREAPFPQGPYVLAHMLGCPVYLMFCLRQNGGYRLYFEMFAERITLPRRNKDDAVREWAARYSRRLEAFCLIDPYQWYNFYDFWKAPSARVVEANQ